MIFKQETIKSWFAGVGSSINNEVVQPFQNASNIISKYNLAIQRNSLTQQEWKKILAQSDDSLRTYLTSIKGTTASMSGYNVSLQGNITGFTKITNAMQQYNALGVTSQKEQQTFATAIGVTNSKLRSYLTGLNGAEASLSGYGLSLITSTAKTIGLTVATTALNASLTMGISLIVSGLISAFVSWIHKSEEITEKAQEAANKINSINNSLKSNTETVENTKKRYAELAQEVENLGKITQSKGNLSNEEYEEFLDLSNQLAGIFPSLTKNYDDNGNAILNLSGDVNTIVGSLDSLIQKEKELANQKIMEEFPDVFKGWNHDLTNAEQKVKSAKKEFDKINNAYQQLSNGTTSQAFDLQGNGWFTNENGEKITISMGEYISSLEALGLEYKETQLKVKNQFGGDTLSGYLIEATGDIDTVFTSKLEKTREDLQYAQQQLEGKTSSINQYLNTWLQGEFSYIQIEDNGLQTAIQDILFNFDWDNIPENKRGDWNYVSEYLRRNILFEINKVQNDSVISKALSEVFTNAELTPDEKANYLQQITDFFGEDSAVVISLNPQIEENETLQKQYDKAIEDTKKKFVGYEPIAFFKEYSINTQEEIDAWQEIAQEARDAAEAEKEYIQESTLNKSPISSFDQVWANSFTSEDGAVKELGNSLLKLAAQGRLTTEAFNQADSEAGDYFKNLGISAEEAVSKINKLVDESSQLSSMSKQLSSITDALETKRDTGFVSADTLSGFDEEIRGLDSWDRFQEVLGSTASSYGECQEAANALAAEWVNSSDFLAQLTEQNEEYYAAQLNAMGIENYEEIIAYAHLAQQQMWSLALAKQAASDDSLNTADDCQRLLDLAQNAGVTGKAISLLTELMGIYNNLSHGIYGTDADTLNEITTRAESIKQNVLNLLSDNSSDTVEPNPRIKLSPRAKETAGSAGRSAAKSFTDALDKELAALDKNLDAGYIVFKDYIQARLALIEDYYGQGKLSADEYYSCLEKHYDTQLSYMDQVVNAVTRRIDTELDALKQQKEDVENFYKVQIDSLEKQKTLLEEANQERQRQKDLQKSLYDMERARNQLTQMVYTEGRGMHYAADDQAIREAQENVDNARYDMQIAGIEKSVSKLEAARDRETDIIDEKISNLEAYRDAWSEVTSTYTEEQENLIAAQILGADWETEILNDRLGILDAFKNQYISIQQAMADAAWQSANEQMKAAKEAEKGASGTQHAKKGLNLVGEKGAEAYFDNHGHAAIVTEPTLIPMEGGEVITPVQPGSLMWDLREKFNAYVSKSSGGISSVMASVDPLQNDMARRADSIGTVNNITNPGIRQVTIGDIHVTCPGVTSQEVARQVGAELNRQFSGLSLAALQESKK